MTVESNAESAHCLQDLSRLTHQEGGEDRTKSTSVVASTSNITAAGKMPLALTALHALLRHLELLGNPTNVHSFSLTIGETGTLRFQSMARAFIWQPLGLQVKSREINYPILDLISIYQVIEVLVHISPFQAPMSH